MREERKKMTIKNMAKRNEIRSQTYTLSTI